MPHKALYDIMLCVETSNPTYATFRFTDVKADNSISWARIMYHVVEGKKGNVFYLMTHSTHFVYCYMVSDVW